MLKTIDVLLGLSVVMLTVSLVVTVLTQAITNVLQSRGKNLLDGIAGLLRQIHADLPEDVSRRIADVILTHPLIKAVGSRYGSIIHREELTVLLLELAAGEGPKQLEPDARAQLLAVLKKNGIDDPAKTLDNVRAIVLQIEQAHPELSNDVRHSMALLQEANSKFLAKINGWFDQTMDRVSDRFTNSARRITFVGSLLVALVLQLDTAALVNRLSSDSAFRQALVQDAMKANQEAAKQQQPSSQAAPAISADGKPAIVIPTISDQDRQNLQKLAAYDVIEFPQNIGDWLKRWTPQNSLMKLLGIVLTAMLLSLGAPFWYNALKNLIRLRSLLAQNDDDQRNIRQTNQTAPDSTAGATAPASTAVIVGERGDLERVG